MYPRYIGKLKDKTLRAQLKNQKVTLRQERGWTPRAHNAPQRSWKEVKEQVLRKVQKFLVRLYDSDAEHHLKEFCTDKKVWGYTLLLEADGRFPYDTILLKSYSKTINSGKGKRVVKNRAYEIMTTEALKEERLKEEIQ